jgi:hypothetical protein
VTAEDRAALDRAADILLERAQSIRTHEVTQTAGLPIASDAVFKRYCNALDAHLSIRRVLLEKQP